MVQWRPDYADPLRAQATKATRRHKVQRRLDGAVQLRGCSGGLMAIMCVLGRPDGADQLRGCIGGLMAPTTSCVPGVRKQPGHMVPRRPVIAPTSRVPGAAEANGAHGRCSGGSMAPPGACPGRGSGRGTWTVQWRPGGPDQLRARAVEATGVHGAVAARWRRPAVCPGCESNGGKWCSDGPMAPTSRVPGLRKRPRHTVQWQPDGADQPPARAAEATGGTWCSDGPMTPTTCVPGPRKQPHHVVQCRPVGANPLRARAAEATMGDMVERHLNYVVN
eukprot:jgi/Tetstr1/438606/TSEL_027157.t1